MSTAVLPVYEWNTLPWKDSERRVFKLQKRIYRASQRGDQKTVHRLQRLLMRSWSARCLAVRKVTQDNQGKKTAGVDGVKALTPPQRLTLTTTLRPKGNTQPVRRVWIPKSGTTEQRPLGIPTMRIRAEQTLVKLALEPEWEARFEPNSYGFRPGRSCHDAIAAIFLSISQTPKYVLDADIAKCFERISHPALLAKLRTFPALRRIIHAWLTAGVLDGTELFPTVEGVPQGGPLSPLLANVALHGLETTITTAFPATRWIEGQQRRWRPTVIRYADDLVVLHPDRQVIAQCQQIAANWLRDMGLELKPSKTRITHTLYQADGPIGFDFLGFQVRQYPVGKTHSGKRGGHGRLSVLLNFKTLIRPSTTAQQRHLRAIRTIIRQCQAADQETLIYRLTPLIRGWTRYYSTVASKQIFAKLSNLTYIKLARWAKRRHPGKPAWWLAKRYWRRDRKRNAFATPEGHTLYSHAQTPIERHTKVRGTKSPYDGDWVYWTLRQGRHPDAPSHIVHLLRRQKGRCAWCGLYFKDGDLSELDHTLPTARGGQHHHRNWQLIHRHCHDGKTVHDGSLAARSTTDKDQTIEEPDAVKMACPVLKPGGGGDPAA
jgi:RNA-directed DNA polymerase